MHTRIVKLYSPARPASPAWEDPVGSRKTYGNPPCFLYYGGQSGGGGGGRSGKVQGFALLFSLREIQIIRLLRCGEGNIFILHFNL